MAALPAPRPVPVRRRVGAGISQRPDAVDLADLERQICAGSATVKTHLDRVNHYVAAADSERTFGALIDLFIATGPAAAELRSRALHWSRPVIAADNHDALAARVSRPVGTGAVLPFSEHSLLRRTNPDLPDGAQTAPRFPGTRRGVALDVDRFDPAQTLLAPVIAAMETARSASLAKRIEGDFGTVVVTPGSIAVRVNPRVDLSQVRPDQVTVSSGRITAADLTGAFTPGIGLWNLALAVAAQRLPRALDTAATYRLTHMPDLTRIDRVGPDARILSQLFLESIRLDDLLASEPTTARSVVTAAWVCGMLSVVSP